MSLGSSVSPSVLGCVVMGIVVLCCILGLRSSGSCVSSRVISGCVWNWCMSGVKSVTVDFSAGIKSKLSFR